MELSKHRVNERTRLKAYHYRYIRFEENKIRQNNNSNCVLKLRLFSVRLEAL